MVNLFVPYAGSKPATVMVKGHKLLILSNDAESLSEKLHRFGANKVKKVEFDGLSATDEELSRLSESVEAKIVVAPDDVKIEDLLVTLENQLPWLQ